MTGYVGPIDTLTLQNAYFRQIVFTATHAQLVVMCLQQREAIVTGVNWTKWKSGLARCRVSKALQ